MWLLAFLLCAATPAAGAAERFVLPNGLRVVTRHDAASPLVAVQLWVETGSADEGPEQIGFAHLIEHLLFGGATDGKAAVEIERLGGRINGFTTRDYTVYHMVVPAAAFAEGLAGFARLIELPALDEKRLRNEIRVVAAEWKQNHDSARVQVSEALFAAFFGTHPYGRPIIGDPATLGRATPEELLAFYRAHYTAKNMVLSVAGNFPPDGLQAAVAQSLGVLAGGEAAVTAKSPQPQPTQPQLRTLTRRTDRAYLSIAFAGAAARDSDAPALDLLAFILGRGESARLQENVKTASGLATSVSASTFAGKQGGLFVVDAEVESGKVSAAISAIMREVDRLRREPVAPAELSRAYVNFDRAFVRSRETMEGTARQLATFEALYGDVEYQDVYVRKIRTIDAAALKAAAERFLNPGGVTIAVAAPAEAALPNIDNIDIADATAVNSLIVQRSGSLLSATLENGATIFVLADHRLPVVTAHAAMIGGLAVENEHDTGIGHFIAEMLTQGSRRWSSAQLVHDVEAAGGSLGAYSGYSTIALTGSFPAEQAGNGLDLFFDVFLAPTFPEDALERKRRDILLAIRNRTERSADRALRFFYRTLLEDHPYGLDPFGVAGTVSRFTREDLVKHYRRLLSPERLAVTVAGDVDAEATLRFVAAKLSSLEKNRKLPALPSRSIVIRTPRAAKRAVDLQQTQIFLGYAAPARGQRDYYTMKVLEAILSQMGGRLFVELRDRQGLAYSVGAVSLDDPLAGAFVLYAGADGAEVERVKAGMLREIQRLREEEILPDELERAKNYVIGQYLIQRQSLLAKSVELTDSALFGLADFGERYVDEIRKVSAVDLLKFAWRYLPPDRYTLAVMGK
ncbi:MAG TPA: pitrilysin family protein [Candidatus Binatia bacterium]|nr:pitrilysin family protein [Candidatus Binatia bacterium]